MICYQDYLKSYNSCPLAKREEVISYLSQLTSSISPSYGTHYPGGSFSVLSDMVKNLGLNDYFEFNFNNSGNAILLMGKTDIKPDLLVCAHLDFPTFKIKKIINEKEALLWPMCANRFPKGKWETQARAVGCDSQKNYKFREYAIGKLISHRNEHEEKICFLAETGSIERWLSITLHHPLTIDGNIITANSLDDVTGVIILLSIAYSMKKYNGLLKDKQKKVLFAFIDNEEGHPEGGFSQGIPRLMETLQGNYPKSAIVLDTHTTLEEGGGAEMGKGISYGYVSAGGKGVPVGDFYAPRLKPLEIKLKIDYPDIAQENQGYFSRSMDPELVKYVKEISGLFGTPVRNIHLGSEQCDIRDIISGGIYLGCYVLDILGLVDKT